MSSSQISTSINHRIKALDILRGITIAFMIIVNNPGSWEFVYAPLKHASWNGCTPTDLVFPFFVTIVGISMILSKSNESSTHLDLLGLIKRAALIFLIGLLLNWFPFYEKNFGELRILGVLQRIAMSYFLAGILLHFFKIKNALWIAIGLAIIYSAILIFGGNTLEHNLPNTIDLWLLGEKHVYGGYGIPFDPEGIIGTLGTSINVLVGAWIGMLMKKISDHKDKAISCLKYGLIFLSVAIIYSFILPINKPLWSPSYAFFTSGICILIFSSLLYITDVLKITKPFELLRIYGLNALAAYVLSGLIIKSLLKIQIQDKNLYAFSYDNFFSKIGTPHLGSFVQAISFSAFIWVLVYLMHKKKWYWRV